MRLQTDPASKLWQTLEKLRLTLGLEHRAFSELMETSYSQYQRQRLGSRSPSALSIEVLGARLNLSFEAILRDEIDYPAAWAYFSGVSEHLPERYRVAAHSRRRPVMHILHYLSERYGEAIIPRVLRNFQIHPRLVRDLDGRVNVLLITDLCRHLADQGFTESEFFEAGCRSIAVNRGGRIEQVLRAERTLRAVYERLVLDLTPLFDENHHYRMKSLSDSRALVEIHQKPEVAEALRLRVFGHPQACVARRAIGATAPYYLGLPNARSRELQCVHRGDKACLYEMDFEFSRQILRKRTPEASRDPFGASRRPIRE
jgi:hypothetical protein